MNGVTCFNAGMTSKIKFGGKLCVKADDDVRSHIPEKEISQE
jgi:hypothetical protein